MRTTQKPTYMTKQVTRKCVVSDKAQLLVSVVTRRK